MLQLNSEKHFHAENVGREWKGGFHHEAIGRRFWMWQQSWTGGSNFFSHRNLFLTVPRFRDWMVSPVCPFQSNCRDIVQSSNEEKSTFYPVAHFKTSIYVTMVHVTKGGFSEAISYKKSKYTFWFSVSSWLRWPFNALISLHSVQS